MKKLIALLAGGLAASSALAADGTLWVKNDSGKADWSTPANWYYDTPAGDGGIVWSIDNMLDKLNQDVDGLELTGFSFGGRWMCVTNKPIKFVAPYSWLTRDLREFYTHCPGWEVVLRGTGDNVMNIAGNGEMHTTTAAEDFANFRLLGNTIRAWNTSGDLYAKGNVQLLEATASVEPQNAAGDDSAVTIASAAGTKFVYGPSLGRLRVSKNKGNSTTLTIGTMERFANGGVMAIEAASGLGNLGVTERVKVLSGAPETVNGICDASIVGSSLDSPYPLSFLAYDGAAGFKAASVAPVAFAQAAAADLAQIDGNVSVSGEKQVHALYVKGQPTVSFADGAVLKVGDGTHPAGIIFNPTSNSKIQPTLSGDKGTIAFGGSLGCIYFNNPAENPALTINQTITGTGGVVFSGGFMGGSTSGFSLKRPAGWTGATVVTRARLSISSSDQLPENGDIYVMGGFNNPQPAAGLRIVYTMTFGENQRFHFSGYGHGGSGKGGAAIHMGGAAPTFTFDGPVELNGPGGFFCDGADDKLVFNGAVTGGGWWRFNIGIFRFTKPMDYTGLLYAYGSAAQLVFSGEGRPGPGEIKYETSTATLLFENLSAAFTFTNAVSGKGVIKVVNSDVTLAGRQTYGKLVVGDGAVVRIGKDVEIGNVVSEGSGYVVSADGTPVAVSLMTAEGETAPMAGNSSFAESVTFIKKGPGTATLARNAVVSGAVCVAEGTLKMGTQLAYEAAYWLDASDDRTVVREDDGTVSAWLSRIDGTSFSAANVGNNAGSPMYTNTVNGLPAVSFNWEEGDRIAPNRTFVHRTVFLCMRPNRLHDHDWASPWGRNATDYGLRFWNGTPGHWDAAKSSTAHFADGSASDGSDAFRKNGKFETSSADGETQIITLLNRREDGSDAYTIFKPSVGGCFGQPKDRAFDGEICELIAFDRILTDVEIKEVENYLSEKWSLKEVCWNDGVPTGGAAFRETAKVSVEIGGILDLNGFDQTVAELTGCGEITNSSSSPAVLTVTGTCTFSGKISGNVILRKAGDGDVELGLEVGDGGVEVASGKVAFAPYVQGPCTNGIIYWLDAAWNPSETITMDGDNLVSEVKSRGGVVEKFTSAYNKPVYLANAIDGNKPAFDFRSRRALKTDRTVSTKTIVMVLQRPADTGITQNYFWGRYNADKGFRFLWGTSIETGYSLNGGAFAFASCGDYFVLNGTKTMIEIDKSPSFANRETTYRLFVSRNDWHADANFDNVTDAIGSYENRDCDMVMAEVISYDHVLSDDEIRQVDKYLAEKWCSAGPIPAPAPVFSATSTLTVDGGEADVSGLDGTSVGTLGAGPQGGTVTGDIAASDFTYDAKDATAALPLNVTGDLTIADGADFTAMGLGSLKRTSWTLLTSGSATGEFDGFSAGPRKWAFKAGDASWGISPFGFLLQLK